MADSVPEAQSGFVQTPIFNQMVPDEGAKSVRATCDWENVDEYTVDLTDAMQRGIIRSVQSLYIDNRDNSNAVTIQTTGSQQRITFPGLCQGYVPILLPVPGIFTVASTSSATKTFIHCLNVPMYPYIWLL